MPRCHCVGVATDISRLAEPGFHFRASQQFWYDGVDCIYRPLFDAIVVDDPLYSVCTGRGYFLPSVATDSVCNFFTGIVLGAFLVYSFPSFGNYDEFLEEKYPAKIAALKRKNAGQICLLP